MEPLENPELPPAKDIYRAFIAFQAEIWEYLHELEKKPDPVRRLESRKLRLLLERLSFSPSSFVLTKPHGLI